MTNYCPTNEDRIAGLRVRRTWRGKLILQIRRRVKKAILAPPDRGGVQWESAGLGPWRDANGNDAAEIADVAALLSGTRTRSESEG